MDAIGEELLVLECRIEEKLHAEIYFAITGRKRP